MAIPYTLGWNPAQEPTDAEMLAEMERLLSVKGDGRVQLRRATLRRLVALARKGVSP